MRGSLGWALGLIALLTVDNDEAIQRVIRTKRTAALVAAPLLLSTMEFIRGL